MKSKLTKYGIMTIAAVLLVAMAFAGAASADYVEVNNWTELRSNVYTWTNQDEMRTIVLNNNSIVCEENGCDYSGITVQGMVTIMPNQTSGEFKIDALGKGRLFWIVDYGTKGNLTLCGNKTNPLATLNLTGGKYAVDAYGSGGAIDVSNGNLTIDEGVKITNCSAYRGGGVSIESMFVLNGGNITDCSAVEGGGVYISSTYSSHFTMNKGTISECSATNNGGGVFVYYGKSFNMTGGKITGNNAVNGSGVYLDASEFIINNTALVDTNNDVYLDVFVYPGYDDEPSVITLGDGGIMEGYGAKNISVNMGKTYSWVGKTIVNGSASYHATTENFALSPALSSVYMLKESGNDLILAEKPATYVEVNTWAGLNKSIAEWTDTENARTVAVNESILDRVAGNETTGINVYGKIILTTNESPVTGIEAVINGNGLGRLFTIQTGGNLTLCGNGTSSTLNLTGANASVSGIDYLFGGAVFVNSGTLTLNSGAKITNCSANAGGAVYSLLGTEFTMNGGTISDCKVIGAGAGVMITGGKFKMYDGNIYNCEATVGKGAGVYNSNGIFEMFGGNISNCAATEGKGSGVYNYGTFNISGDAVIEMNNDVALHINGDNVSNINVVDASTFTGSIGSIVLSDGDENPGAWVGKVVVQNGSSVKDKFALSTASAYSSYQLTTSGNDLILSKKSTPYTPSSSKQTGSTVILSEGQVAPTAYATAAPTVAPTVKPTEKTATPTVIATAAPTTQPTETQKSPAPVIGIIAGLGAAAVLLRMRK